jgi:hypothetical protein
MADWTDLPGVIACSDVGDHRYTEFGQMDQEVDYNLLTRIAVRCSIAWAGVGGGVAFSSEEAAQITSGSLGPVFPDEFPDWDESHAHEYALNLEGTPHPSIPFLLYLSPVYFDFAISMVASFEFDDGNDFYVAIPEDANYGSDDCTGSFDQHGWDWPGVNQYLSDCPSSSWGTFSAGGWHLKMPGGWENNYSGEVFGNHSGVTFGSWIWHSGDACGGASHQMNQEFDWKWVDPGDSETVEDGAYGVQAYDMVTGYMLWHFRTGPWGGS